MTKWSWRPHAPHQAGEKNSSIRWSGILLFPIVIGESVLGIISASEGSLSSSDILIAHITVGLGLVVVVSWALVNAAGQPSGPARNATVIAFLFIAGAASTGAIFLQTRFPAGALIDRIFALAALGGTILMVVWGSVLVPESSKPATTL